MAVDELGNPIIEPNEPQLVPVARVNELSGKIRGLSEAADLEKKNREAAETKTAEVERERDFYQGFAEVLSTNPAAKDHKDEILTKVKSGYTVEDATYAVLGKAGKLGQPTPDPEMTPTGGSATTTPPQGGSKSIQEMTREERKQAVIDAEKRGDISLT